MLVTAGAAALCLEGGSCGCLLETAGAAALCLEGGSCGCLPLTPAAAAASEGYVLSLPVALAASLRCWGRGNSGQLGTGS